MKLNRLKVFMLLGAFLLFMNSSPQPVQAWGLVTHQFIVEEAIKQLDDDWRSVFDALISQFKSGSIYPDSLHDAGDTPNHLYYPGDDSGTTAPQAIERWYNYFVGNLSNGNYADAVFSAGVFGHYLGDVNIPIHTDNYWDGHPAYESDINRELSNLALGTISIDTDIANIQQYVKDAASNAHPYYSDIVSAYPDGSTSDVISTNTTIKIITENQLTHAVSNVASLIIKGIGESMAPIVDIVSGSNALIDYAHMNDYATGNGSANFKLSSYENFLVSKGFSVLKNNNSFSTGILEDVNFLIISAIGTDFTTDELNVLSSWLNTGKRSIFITGRGDYQSYSHTGINKILETIGSVIRVNDDNVYSINSDPHYYKDHYIYTEVTTPPPGGTYPDEAIIYHTYAPNSLYFEGTSDSLTVLVNGSKYNYQSELNPPVPTEIWDDTNDGVGGEVIPLVASESLSDDDDRLVVFGATDFSDFSFGPSGFHDDEFFIPEFTKWVLFGTLGEGIFYLPDIQIITTQTSFSGTITIDYQVSDNVNEVQFLVDGVEMGVDTSKPLKSFVIDLKAGSYNITLVAKTNQGDLISKSLNITVTGSESVSSPWEFLYGAPLLLGLTLIRRRRNGKKIL